MAMNEHMRATEQWRPIEGFEGRYEVSDQGRVRSLRQRWHGVDRLRAEPLMLRPRRTQGASASVQVGTGNSQIISRLVLAAFERPPAPRERAIHLNGDLDDDRRVNLRWMSWATACRRAGRGLSTITCPACGKTVRRDPSKVTPTSGCSRTCAALLHRGEANPAWKGDAATAQTGRARAIKAFPLRPCEECGSTARVQRHHVDQNPLNNDPSNIRFLCHLHHRRLHARLDKQDARAELFAPAEAAS